MKMQGTEFMHHIRNFVVERNCPPRFRQQLKTQRLTYSWDWPEHPQDAMDKEVFGHVISRGFVQENNEKLVVYGSTHRDAVDVAWTTVHELAHVIYAGHGEDWAALARVLGVAERAYKVKACFGDQGGHFAWADPAIEEIARSLPFDLEASH
jgi:hypothetical protein